MGYATPRPQKDSFTAPGVEYAAGRRCPTPCRRCWRAVPTVPLPCKALPYLTPSYFLPLERPVPGPLESRMPSRRQHAALKAKAPDQVQSTAARVGSGGRRRRDGGGSTCGDSGLRACPSRLSESPVRVAWTAMESSVRVAKSPARVACPSRLSESTCESPVRVARKETPAYALRKHCPSRS
jgi:hypothetical protein